MITLIPDADDPLEALTILSLVGFMPAWLFGLFASLQFLGVGVALFVTVLLVSVCAATLALGLRKRSHASNLLGHIFDPDPPGRANRISVTNTIETDTIFETDP